jgi:hypothetical protein
MKKRMKRRTSMSKRERYEVASLFVRLAQLVVMVWRLLA